MTGVHRLWFVAVLLLVTSTALVTVGKCVCEYPVCIYVCAMALCVQCLLTSVAIFKDIRHCKWQPLVCILYSGFPEEVINLLPA